MVRVGRFPDPASPPAPGEPETPDRATLHQNTYRKVLLGQVSDPLFPPHPGPPEVPEAEMVRQALADPGGRSRDAFRPVPGFWRWMGLAALAALALGIVLAQLRPW